MNAMLENALFETHFNIIPFPIYVVDFKTYEILFSNQHFQALFGDHRGAVCHAALYQRETPCMGCRIPEVVDETGRPNGRTVVFEHFNETDDNWYQMQEKAMSWPDGRVVKYSIAVNITELKHTQNKLAEAHAQLALKTKELEQLATHDTLTGVLNRLKLDKALEAEMVRAVRYARPLSAILVDIDHFKLVNDEKGHQTGDEVLVAFALLLKNNLRANDIFGRWGGEEFLLLCPETECVQAEQLAEKLRTLVEEKDFPGIARLTASFGVTQLVAGDTEPQFMQRVDAALYKAKEAGRNKVATLP